MGGSTVSVTKLQGIIVSVTDTRGNVHSQHNYVQFQLIRLYFSGMLWRRGCYTLKILITNPSWFVTVE